MNRKYFFVIILMIFFLVSSCKERERQVKSITKEIVFSKEGELNLKKVNTDSI